MAAFDPHAAARFVRDAHASRAPYENLPGDLAPTTVAEAYAAQEALQELWTPLYGPIAGLKIATTTKVMQQLMGIDHPCGGMIYERRIHTSPAKVSLGDYSYLCLEFELAVRLKAPLPARAEPYTASEVRAAVGEVMPAFELIEDRNAHYKSTKALSLIADNAWNAGIVLGTPVQVALDSELNGIRGRLTVNGVEKGTGTTDDPMGALAWLANLAVERKRPIQAGMVVITGSVIPTLAPATTGEMFRFDIEGLGAVELALA
jgi:2-keto-4-pentenoate hydratase